MLVEGASQLAPILETLAQCFTYPAIRRHPLIISSRRGTSKFWKPPREGFDQRRRQHKKAIARRSPLSKGLGFATMETFLALLVCRWHWLDQSPMQLLACGNTCPSKLGIHRIDELRPSEFNQVIPSPILSLLCLLPPPPPPPFPLAPSLVQICQRWPVHVTQGRCLGRRSACHLAGFIEHKCGAFFGL